VSKFAVVSLHWDLWTVFRGFFSTIDMRAAPAMPAILLASIASFSRYDSGWDACVSELSAFLNLRLEVAKRVVGVLSPHFLHHSNASSSSAASHSPRLHSVVLAMAAVGMRVCPSFVLS
jgi:hypothetical protein